MVSSTWKTNISLSPFTPENLVLRDEFGSPVPRQPAHLHTTLRLNLVLTTEFLPNFATTASIYLLFKPPYAIGPVPSFSGHAIAYQWRSLPGVSRHRASEPQGSSKRVLPWQVTMDQLLICASLSHTHTTIGMNWACFCCKYRLLQQRQQQYKVSLRHDTTAEPTTTGEQSMIPPNH